MSKENLYKNMREITVSVGLTKNLGNYESLKLDVSYTLTSPTPEMEAEAFEVISNELMKQEQAIREKIKATKGVK